MATPTVNVLYLETGHVLAALRGGGTAVPEAAALTGGRPLRVRFPDRDVYVDVPLARLKVMQVALDERVLDRPYGFRIMPEESTPLGDGDAVTDTVPTGPPNAKYLIVTQAGADYSVTTGTLNAAGTIPATNVPGADARLIAVEGGPLVRNPLP